MSARVLGFAALAACLRGNAAMAPDPQPAVQPALGAAGLEDAAGVAQELKDLGLSQLQDVRLLDAEEAREMMGALRGSAVSLGDRSRLRRLVTGPAELEQSLESPRSVSGALSNPAARAEAESSCGQRAMHQRREYTPSPPVVRTPSAQQSHAPQ